MTKPEKRWQLLLVADDGRIVPFKRIKGLAVSLAVLLGLLALTCAGLGWRLSLINQQHRLTLDRLAQATREAAHYRSEHELVAAELVLAEARMEKAGLEVPRRKTPNRDTEAADTAADLSGAAKHPKDASTAAASLQAAAAPSAAPAAVAPSEAPSAASPPPPDAAPPVDLTQFEMHHDTAGARLQARFRVSNAGPPSSPVSGRCVVVLKSDPQDPGTWTSLPAGALVDGTPDARRGQAFRISRFIDVDITAAVQSDPSVYHLATVYVLDADGGVLLKQDYAIDLPASASASAPTVAASASSEPATSLGGEADEAAVEVDAWRMEHDMASRLLRARFRVNNSGPRSSTVAGRCVVVLKSGQLEPQAWLQLPDGDLSDGRPTGAEGQAFRISRFRDMAIEAAARSDPSVFTTATVYVFDDAGNTLLEKDFPVDLPGLPEPTSRPDPPPVPEPAADDRPLPTPGVPPDTAGEPPAARDDGRARF